MFKIRNAEESDIFRIWQLRNAPTVRKNSLNSNKIKYKNHVKYITTRLNEFFIIEENNMFIGYYRIENDNYISIYLKPNVRNKGYGQQILNKLYGKAVIMCHNLISLHAFIKGGWIIRGFYLEKKDTLIGIE